MPARLSLRSSGTTSFCGTTAVNSAVYPAYPRDGRLRRSEKRRIAFSVAESARRARDAAEIAESREMTDVLDRSKEAKTFGTLANLLAAPTKSKPGS